MTIVFLFAALLQGTAPSMNVIDRGPMSQIESARQAVARTPDEWSALWRAHASNRQPPMVDFSKSMAVAVFLGTRPTAGYGVEIVGTTEKNGALVVQYRETRPAAGTMSAQILTAPYAIVSLPTRPGDVRFEKIEN